MTKYKFKCIECKEVFSIESEEVSVLKVQNKIRCPFCGTKGSDGDLEQQIITVSNKKSKEGLARENAERSAMAREMAAKFKASEPPEENITVVSPDGDGKSVKVPKQVADSITNKLETAYRHK